MPSQTVAGNTPTVTATPLSYDSNAYPNPWPFPTAALIEQGDMHGLAFDVGNCKLKASYDPTTHGFAASTVVLLEALATDLEVVDTGPVIHD